MAIIGAGQLGSRHLQALSKLNEKVNLYIVDPNEESLKIAQSRFSEIQSVNKTLYKLKKIKELPKELEFVVIATNSVQRLTAMEELLSHAEVRYLLLEKFLFPYKFEYEEANKLLLKNKTLVYVNCARTMWGDYQELKARYDFKQVEMNFSGGLWNMASNSIHFISLLTFLTNDKIKNIDMSKVNDELIENKRAGYIEISGTIKITTENGSVLTLTSSNEYKSSLLSIKTGNTKIAIEEQNGFIEINGEQSHFKVEHQSSLTNKVYEQLKNEGFCNLVNFNQSSEEHLCFLQGLNEFLGERKGVIT